MTPTNITKNYPGEKWEPVKFDFEYVNENRIEVSNFGRVRSFNKSSNGNLLKLSTTNGYHIIHFKFFKERDEKTDVQLNLMKEQSSELLREIKQMKLTNRSTTIIEKAEKNLVTHHKKLSKAFAEATKKRTINYHSLIHRLVAIAFLNPPTAEQIIVTHLDFDKLNNRVSNLRWITTAESLEFQKRSPHVIKAKEDRKYAVRNNPSNTKLTVTKVMLLKKMLNQGKPMKQLVKLFKVSDTQILRIKRGENWKRIEAAE